MNLFGQGIDQFMQKLQLHLGELYPRKLEN